MFKAFDLQKETKKLNNACEDLLFVCSHYVDIPKMHDAHSYHFNTYYNILEGVLENIEHYIFDLALGDDNIVPYYKALNWYQQVYDKFKKHTMSCGAKPWHFQYEKLLHGGEEDLIPYENSLKQLFNIEDEFLVLPKKYEI